MTSSSLVRQSTEQKNKWKSKRVWYQDNTYELLVTFKITKKLNDHKEIIVFIFCSQYCTPDLTIMYHQLFN